MRSIKPIALAGVCLAAPMIAQAGEVTDFTLDNGLQVVVIEDHRSAAVTQMVWYRVGSADEPRGQSGIAHLLEHLMFKGTDTTAPGEFSDIVTANGGNGNAFTSYDYTAYFQRVAADLLPRMMELEADRMANLTLTEELTAPELSVVLEERAQRIESDPGAQLSEQMRAAQYLNHPYGVPIIGWRAETAALTYENALEFYGAHYVPNNAVLVVAGDTTPDEVRRLAEETYGQVPANPDLAARDRVDEPPQTAARTVTLRDGRVGQPRVSRSYLAPERDPGDQETAAALTLLAELLGGDQTTSYLGRRLQFEDQVAVYAAAYYGGTSLDDTTFGMTVVPAQGVSLEDAEAALDSALADFMDAGIDQNRLDRLKRQYAAQEVYEQDDVGQIARKYGAALTSGLTVSDVEAWPDLIQSVTAEDIMAAAGDVLAPNRAVTGYLRPEGDSATSGMTQAGFDIPALEVTQ